MKKVALSVCYDTKNYGSQLQVLATIEKIKELGYEPEIIKYNKKISIRFILQTLPRFLNSYFVRSKLKGIKRQKALKKHPEILKNVNIRNERFDRYIKEKYSEMLKIYNGWNELVYKANNDYEIFLCGSDQLWLPANLGSHFYTLEYVTSNKNKIAYATSFGVSQIPWYQKRRTRKYLNDFTHLSCREEKGKQIIKELTNKDIPVVLDPTLLLTKDEWDEIIQNKKVINEKYIMCYFLGENVEHRRIAEELSKKTGYKIVTIPFLDEYVEYDRKFGNYRLFDIDIYDFVNLIRNSEYVLTDSFHGSIFSILNHKKFMVLNRFSNNSKNSRNSRIDNLCAMLGLNDRRYNGKIDCIMNDIDYIAVDMCLEKIRNNSKEYLKNALEGIKENEKI